MDDLIKINYKTGEPRVSARDLHEGLEIGTKFATWFPRMTEYGFVENTDYMLVTQKRETNNLKNPFTQITDYQITIDMAKQICMIQRTEKGRQYRQYFLDLEKAWNTPEQVMARALKIANATVDSLKERCKFLGGQVIEQQKVIETLEPKASYYDLVLQSPDLITTTIIAKDYGMSAKKFNAMLKDMHIQFKLNGNWVLYQEHAGNGYAKYRTHLFEDHEGVGHTKEHLHWTQKGRLFLYDSLKQIGILPEIEK